MTVTNFWQKPFVRTVMNGTGQKRKIKERQWHSQWRSGGTTEVRRTRAEPQVDFTTILSGLKSLPWDSAARPFRSWALTRIMRSQKKVQGDLYLHVMACWWRSRTEGATEGGERTDQVSVGPKKKILTMTQEVKDRWSETVRMWCQGRAKPDRTGIIRARAEQWKYAIK